MKRHPFVEGSIRKSKGCRFAARIVVSAQFMNARSSTPVLFGNGGPMTSHPAIAFERLKTLAHITARSARLFDHGKPGAFTRCVKALGRLSWRIGSTLVYHPLFFRERLGGKAVRKCGDYPPAFVALSYLSNLDPSCVTTYVLIAGIHQRSLVCRATPLSVGSSRAAFPAASRSVAAAQPASPGFNLDHPQIVRCWRLSDRVHGEFPRRLLGWLAHNQGRCTLPGADPL